MKADKLLGKRSTGIGGLASLVSIRTSQRTGHPHPAQSLNQRIPVVEISHSGACARKSMANGLEAFVKKEYGTRNDVHVDTFMGTLKAHTRDDIVSLARKLINDKEKNYTKILILASAHGQIVGEDYTEGDVVSAEERRTKGHYITLDSDVLTIPLTLTLKRMGQNRGQAKFCYIWPPNKPSPRISPRIRCLHRYTSPPSKVERQSEGLNIARRSACWFGSLGRSAILIIPWTAASSTPAPTPTAASRRATTGAAPSTAWTLRLAQASPPSRPPRSDSIPPYLIPLPTKPGT